jgi:predicted trehalose synthase
MELVFVTFESESSREAVESRVRARAQQFRDVAGLLQEFY